MKIIFFGSDDFALTHLGKLYNSEHQVVACVTQPDKAKGRGLKMIAQMDAGDIFAQAKIKIGPQETSVSLRSQMASLGAELLLKTINSLEKNAYTLAAQDKSKVTFAPKLTKELGAIDWNKDAQS